MPAIYFAASGANRLSAIHMRLSICSLQCTQHCLDCVQDMVDAAGRAAAADIIAQLLAKPDLWVDMGSSPGGSDAAAVSFGGSAWAGALAELAAKVQTPEDCMETRQSPGSCTMSQMFLLLASAKWWQLLKGVSGPGCRCMHRPPRWRPRC